MKVRLTGLVAIALASFVASGHATGVSGQGTWETTLQARDLDGNVANGPEVFYDTALNITWLAIGSTTDMHWSDAVNWAKQDRFGLSGWRLPTLEDRGWAGCNWYPGGVAYCDDNSSSEMGRLFLNSLGNKRQFVQGTVIEQPGWGLTNTAKFQDLQPHRYWTGTKDATQPGFVWYFSTVDGTHGSVDADYFGTAPSIYALAVRSGDISTAVPEPQTYALMLAGLGLIAGVARRRGKQ